MESCLTWEIATLNLPNKMLQANLWQLVLAILDPDKPHQQLFHSVSKTFTKDGNIFQFHPGKIQHAHGVVTGLLVFLKGMWEEHLDMKKFYKFFNDGAIDRAADSWWDPETKTVQMRADAEMEKILHQDDDYHFLVMKIDATLLQGMAKAKEDDGMLPTGSYLTFQTMAMAKPKKHTNTREESPNCNSLHHDHGSTIIITMNMLSEQSFSQLVESVVAAIQANHLSNNKNGSPGGHKTGKRK